MDKPMSGFAFAAMSFVFKIRDRIRPPLPKLMEIGIKPGARVLDYGCGPGTFSIEAARLVGESGMVYAVDIHPTAMIRVQAAAEQNGLTNVKAMCAKTPAELETESIDVVILYDIFHLLGDQDGILRELHRVLKADGVLSFSDHHMKEDAILAGVTKGNLFALSKRGKRTYSFKKQAGG
jgi:ubiquinone/menaquinone biosynthesis C-methylase UbiE